jgi:hypothetical protein
MSDPGAEPAAARETFRIPAVHIRGVQSLSPGRAGLELRISDTGVNIFDTGTRTSVGQLPWTEIEALGLPHRRRRLRRRAPRLEITTGEGRACFELPGLTEDQVLDHLAPFLRARGAPPSD